MKQDRLTTWLVVGLLAYMLLLQGTVSAFAKASMTAGELGSTFVICAPSGEDYSETRDRLAGFAHDCCSSVCQLACATGPAALPIGDLVAPTRPTTEPIRTRYVALAVAPGELGLTSDARAPPFFSH